MNLWESIKKINSSTNSGTLRTPRDLERSQSQALLLSKLYSLCTRSRNRTRSKTGGIVSVIMLAHACSNMYTRTHNRSKMHRAAIAALTKGFPVVSCEKNQ